MFLIDHELDWVLVLLEECSMSIGQIGKGPAEVPCLFDGGFIIVGSEPVIFEGKDCDSLEQLVSHEELLRGS